MTIFFSHIFNFQKDLVYTSIYWFISWMNIHSPICPSAESYISSGYFIFFRHGSLAAFDYVLIVFHTPRWTCLFSLSPTAIYFEFTGCSLRGIQMIYARSKITMKTETDGRLLNIHIYITNTRRQYLGVVRANVRVGVMEFQNARLSHEYEFILWDSCEIIKTFYFLFIASRSYLFFSYATRTVSLCAWCYQSFLMGTSANRVRPRYSTVRKLFSGNFSRPRVRFGPLFGSRFRRVFKCFFLKK